MNETRSYYSVHKKSAIRRAGKKIDPKLAQQRNIIANKLKTATITRDDGKLAEAYFKQEDPILKRDILKNIRDDEFHRDLILDGDEDLINVFTSLTIVKDQDFLYDVRIAASDIEDPLLHAVLDYRLRGYKPPKNRKITHYTFGGMAGLFGTSSENLSLGETDVFGNNPTYDALGNIGYTIDQILDMTQEQRIAAIEEGGGSYTGGGSTGSSGADGSQGSSTVLLDPSDIRFKKNITYPKVLDSILKLDTIEYDIWEYDKLTGKKVVYAHEIGVSAQQLREFFPMLVFGNEKTDRLSVDYSHMAAMFIGAFKEMQKKIDYLDNKLEEALKLNKSIDPLII